MRNVLFVNAAFRDGSRTYGLAQKFLHGVSGNVVELDLGSEGICPLTSETLKIYNRAVKMHDFCHPMFNYAKQFAASDEIVVAAPFWNYTLPAVLHDYIELVCTQGITFDLSSDGRYYSLCKAEKLTFITTAGGFIPQQNHAFSFIKDLCDTFWDIKDVSCIKADGIDIYGADKETILENAFESSK